LTVRESVSYSLKVFSGIGQGVYFRYPIARGPSYVASRSSLRPSGTPI
jgi:hypothetical protein